MTPPPTEEIPSLTWGISAKEWRPKLQTLVQEAFTQLTKSSVIRRACLTPDSVTELLKQRYPFNDVVSIDSSPVNKAIFAPYPHASQRKNDTVFSYFLCHTTNEIGCKGSDAQFYHTKESGNTILVGDYPGSNQAKEDWVHFYKNAKEIGNA